MIGPGHFGLLDLGDGVQKFSLHWEADLDRGGASVLDIRPLLWKDGWPVAGENLKEGTYEIESVRTGTALELAVEGMPVGGRRRCGGRAAAPAVALRDQGTGGRARRTAGCLQARGRPIPPQDAAQVSANWPAGNVDVAHGELSGPGAAEVVDRGRAECRRLSRVALFQDHNCRHGPHARRDAGCRTVVAARISPARRSSCGESSSFPTARGASCRSRFRIRKEPLALSAVGSSFATLSKFDPTSDKQRWLLKTP